MRWVACVLLVGCVDGPIRGEPLIESTLDGAFADRPWIPSYGFARVEDGNFLLRVGNDKISCTDDFDGAPPRDGNYATTAAPSTSPSCFKRFTMAACSAGASPEPCGSDH